MSLPPAFADTFNDDVLGAVPANVAGRFGATIQSDPGAILVTGKVESRAVVQVVDAMNPGGHLERVLRVSDAMLGGNGHSEVTILPVNATGKVSLRFNIRLAKLAGDIFKLTVADNRTTPGTGRLSVASVLQSGLLVVQGSEVPFFVEPGVRYHVGVDFDLTGVEDTFSIHVQPIDGGIGFHKGGFVLSVDATMITDVTFSLSDGGKGAFDLDDVRVLHGI